MGLEGSAQVHIKAPPERVYELVSDVTRMGEWSPECYRCRWLGGAGGPVAGARFKGYNRRGWLRWWTTCTVTKAESGQAFAFETHSLPFKGVQTRWRYQMEPSEGGTLLTESFQVLWHFRIVIRLAFGGSRRRQAQMEEGVRRTLAHIKAIAEGV
ncbi:MAG: SRPBCC family protein [Chloroflexi bacterium]|nr:SRPBCC family protein [Chloroflexota bacterium]